MKNKTIQEEPSAKALLFAQQYRDAYNAFRKVGFTSEEVIAILQTEPWHRFIFEDDENE